MITIRNKRDAKAEKLTKAVSFLFFAALSVNAGSVYATGEEVKMREEKTLDLLSRIDAFSQSDPRLIEDSAKAHYNMGNIYFQKGEYEIAVREYYQATTLMPNDPDSHYNLAYVSADFLNDYETALKHFKMYLYLNPEAKDIKYIKEKIVEAELNIKSVTGSRLEEEK